MSGSFVACAGDTSCSSVRPDSGPETDKPSAVHLANKISAQVNELLVHFEDASFQLQANFGVTAWEKGNDSVLLLRKANQGLDTARASGANAIEAV